MVQSSVAITGVAADQTISGLDFRPNTGQLYTIGYNDSTGQARLYTVDLTTGVATAVGAAAVTLAPGMGRVSFDFNPTVDRIRVTGSNGANFRLHPVTGAIAATDSNLAFSATDINVSTTASIGAVAYTNSFPGTGTTTLFNYDANLNVLTTQNPPNAGTLNTVGSIGPGFIGLTTSSDLDIYFDPATRTNTAYLVRNDSSTASTTLYTVNLTNGSATSVCTLDTGVVVQYIAVQTKGVETAPLTGSLVYAVTANNNLISFDSENPSQLQSIVQVTGIVAGQVLCGLDFRPATGALYGLAYNATTGNAQIYTINPTTGVATAVSDAPVSLGTGLGSIGFDFNPVVDRIRVTGSNGSNFRINPITGAIASTDSTLNFAGGDVNQGNGSIGASAYTNSFLGTTATTLFNIAQGLSVLTTQNPPNNGVLNTVGTLGIQLDTTDRSFDLDILYDQTTQSNVAFLAANALGSNTDVLYQVNLTTGAATAVGSIGLGVRVKSIAVGLDSLPTPQDTTGVDLALTASVTPTNYVQYENVTYTITVTNMGTDTAHNVTVSAGLPNGVVYTSSTVSQGEYNLFFERFDVGTLAPGQSATLTLVLFPLVTDSSIVNFFQVMSADEDDTDSTPGNDTDNTPNEDDEALVTIIGPPQPPQGGTDADLSLFASVDSSNYNVYENVTYHLILVNNGPDAADSITVSAELPDGFVYAGDSIMGAGNAQYNLFFERWEIDYLEAGDTARLDLTLFPLADTSDAVTFFQVLTSGQDDPDSTPGNDTDNTPNEDDEALITIIGPPQPPQGGTDADLSLFASVDSSNYNVYENVTYHLILVNNGPDAADSITVSAELPDGFVYAGDSIMGAGNAQYNLFFERWEIDYLEAGDTARLDLTLFPLADTSDAVTFFQVLTSGQDDPDSTPGNDTDNTPNEDDEALITIFGQGEPPLVGGDSSDLSLSVTVDSSNYRAFKNVTYHVVVTNSGPDNADNISVSAELPEGFAYTSASTNSGQYNFVLGTWNLDLLANGDSAFMDYVVFPLVDTAAIVSYFQILTSDQDDSDSTPGNGANNTANEDDEVVVTILGAPQPPQGGTTADLSLFADIDSTDYNIFEDVTYHLYLVNNGPDAAAGITVSAGLPEGFAFTGDTTTVGQYDPFTGIWNVGYLANGDTAHLALTVFPLADSSDVTAYFEVITSDQDDPNSTPGNGDNDEDDQVTVTITPDFNGTEPVENRFGQGIYGDAVLYPVPATNFVSLRVNSLEAQESAVIYIFNQTGGLVRTQATTVVKGINVWTFEVSPLSAGVYFVKLPGASQALQFIKL